VFCKNFRRISNIADFRVGKKVVILQMKFFNKSFQSFKTFQTFQSYEEMKDKAKIIQKNKILFHIGEKHLYMILMFSLKPSCRTINFLYFFT